MDSRLGVDGSKSGGKCSRRKIFCAFFLAVAINIYAYIIVFKNDYNTALKSAAKSMRQNCYSLFLHKCHYIRIALALLGKLGIITFLQLACNAQMAELVDAHGSGPCTARCGGSNPLLGTIPHSPKASKHAAHSIITRLSRQALGKHTATDSRTFRHYLPSACLESLVIIESAACLLALGE